MLIGRSKWFSVDVCFLQCKGNAFKRGLRPKDKRERQRLKDLIDSQADEIHQLKEEIETLSNAVYDPAVPPHSTNPPCGY